MGFSRWQNAENDSAEQTSHQ